MFIAPPKVSEILTVMSSLIRG